MRSGISTACLYPMKLEEAFSALISMGFRVFEVFINTCSELRTGYLKELKRMADGNGCSVKSVHPFTSGFESFLLFSEYERRFEDGLEFYRSYFDACNLLGATILVLHGQRRDARGPEAEKRYFERYARLFGLGRTYGVTVAQENVNLMRSNEADFIRRMRADCGSECAFVFDIKQAVREGKDPLALCKAMGGRLAHVHLNDNDQGSDCRLPGFGTMDYRPLLRILSRAGFDGDLIVEVYRKSFGGLSELPEAKRFTEKLILGMDGCSGNNS